ncbi:MAG: hypothetical protein GX574_07705 [Lentisphaerae bacterium]|jgi:hypothetical protein|nr:hypothetical protein [Lentisphaerota bacterium]
MDTIKNPFSSEAGTTLQEQGASVLSNKDAKIEALERRGTSPPTLYRP